MEGSRVASGKAWGERSVERQHMGRGRRAALLPCFAQR
jgi:hypothetical protein